MFDWFKKKPSAAVAISTQAKASQDSTQRKPRLIELLSKNNKTKLGQFEDLNRDLANYVEKNFETCDPTIKMAYGYARRVAMTGLYFQGVVGQNVVNHVQDIFVGLQKMTGQTIEFQREAANQATEVLKSYVPRLTREHERALLHYAREGTTAVALADDHGYMDIDELEDDPVSIDKCLDLIDYVIDVDSSAGHLFSSADKPNGPPRLIDFVEKVSSSKLGAFANMCDDIKASSHKFVGREPLFAAAGYATILGRCAVFVGGGVNPKIIVDAVDQTKVLMADVEGNEEAIGICKSQAVALASTYVHKLTPEAADVIIEMGLKFERLVDDEKERLSPDEVVLRARRIARDKDVDSFPIGGTEYQQFKDLSKKPNLVDHFASVCAGMSQVPFNVKDDVQKMVGLAQSLISVTGLGVNDVINCAKSNKWASIEDRLSRASASLGPLVEQARPALERLRAWADANNLPPLAQFDSSAYQMTGFPRELIAIFTLRQLHLPNAGLTTLPFELSALPALESICVDGNKLKSLPSGIFSLYSLRRIDAEGNEIEVVPDSIGEARHLQSFDLDGNNLRSVSPEIAQCNSLKRVYLRDQRHGTRLDHCDTPLSDDAMEALASLDARGVDVRF
jgi:hypothetical protein